MFDNYVDNYISHDRVGRNNVSLDRDEIKHPKQHPKRGISCVVIIIFLAIMSISSYCAAAAVISGSVYDLALEKESDVVVEINTVPKQLMVSKDGDYSFNVKPGDYVIKAYTPTSEASEAISIRDEGEYLLDIILSDDVDAIGEYEAGYDSVILAESDISVSNEYPEEHDRMIPSVVMLVLGILLVLALIIFMVILLMSQSRKVSGSSKKSGSGKRHTIKDNVAKIGNGMHAKARRLGSHPSGDPGMVASEHHDKQDYVLTILNIIKKEKRTTQKDIRKAIPLSEAKVSLILADLEDSGKIRKIKKGRGNILIFIKD